MIFSNGIIKKSKKSFVDYQQVSKNKAECFFLKNAKKSQKMKKTDFFDVFEETVRGRSFFQVLSDRFKVFVRHFQ